MEDRFPKNVYYPLRTRRGKRSASNFINMPLPPQNQNLNQGVRPLPPQNPNLNQGVRPLPPQNPNLNQGLRRSIPNRVSLFEIQNTTKSFLISFVLSLIFYKVLSWFDLLEKLYPIIGPAAIIVLFWLAIYLVLNRDNIEIHFNQFLLPPLDGEVIFEAEALN